MTVEPSPVSLQRRGENGSTSFADERPDKHYAYNVLASKIESGATKEEASGRECCYTGTRFVPVYTGLLGRVLLSFSIHGDANPPIKAELILRANVSHNAYNRAHNA